MGRSGLLIAITLASMNISLLICVTSFSLLEKELDSTTLLVAVLAPTIIAPTVTWHIVGLLLKIHRLEKEMRKLAHFDLLTGVMSRRAFLSHSDNIYQLICRNKSCLSIAYIDIDYFKKINDSYGHSCGDAVLASIGTILRTYKRKSDLVGRMGGEEFIILLPDTDLPGAMQFSNKIRLLVKHSPVSYANHLIVYTISIGVTAYNPETPLALEQLIKQADAALYAAKKVGRNCVIAYQSQLASE